MRKAQIVACALALVLEGRGWAQVTQRVSLSTSGVQTNDRSDPHSITPDGRFVAFQSYADNLVPGSPDQNADIFVRDRTNGVTEMISVSSSGAYGNASSYGGWLSADGRYVSFASNATNLAPGDFNGVSDVFLRDRRIGSTELISRNTAGAIGNGPSGGGRITPDGRFVCFVSHSTNLAHPVSGAQVYVRDRLHDTTELISVSSAGIAGDGDSSSHRISDDGRFVAFVSWASNLVLGDVNNYQDVFVRDRQSGVTERVSLTSGGSQAYGAGWDLAMTGDGRHVAFVLALYSLPNIHVRDRLQGTTELVMVAATGYFTYPTLSSDGRFLSFERDATPWPEEGIPDIFVHDRQTGITTTESVDSNGVSGNCNSFQPVMSPDGRFIAFSSCATNLVPGNNNGQINVFVRDRVDGTRFVSLCEPGVGSVIACPCSNPPTGSARGCDNSAGTGGATLDASGGTFLSSDSLVFSTSGEMPTALSFVTQWTGSDATGAVLGMGVRCTSGTLKRLYTKVAVGGSITAPDFGDGDFQVSVRSAALGDVIQPGQNRWYFVYYRDPVVLGGCPPSSNFNSTQTGGVRWAP